MNRFVIPICFLCTAISVVFLSSSIRNLNSKIVTIGIRIDAIENRLDDLEQDQKPPLDNTEHTRIEPFERRA